MTTWQLLTSFWNLKPLVLVGCAALILGYAVALGFRFSEKALFFIAGVLLLLLALVSPLNTLGHGYLFCAHMMQHIILLLIVPLLLLLGLPSSLAEKSSFWPPPDRVVRVLGQPLVGWSLGVGAMWVWHIPALYAATLHNEGLHIVQQLTLLLTGVIFWWPVVAPSEKMRLKPLVSVLYLFSACIGCTILGIVITFAPVGLYSAHLHTNDTSGILPLLRNNWGISPNIDQQVGGLLMWVPCCLIYISIIMLTLARWYRAPEIDIPPTSAAMNTLEISANSLQKEKT
jgi:cytochrome c oxidase assembly factor CtaG